MPEAKVGVNSFNDAIQNLGDRIASFVDRFEAKLEKEISGVKDLIIKRLQEDNLVLHERIKSLENKLEYNLQYQRRNNILLEGLPSGFDEKILESSAVKVLNSIDVKVNCSDIEACHYLPSKNGKNKVIVKLINRKHADSAFRKRSLLKHSDKSFLGNGFTGSIYINKNLMPFFPKYYGNVGF